MDVLIVDGEVRGMLEVQQKMRQIAPPGRSKNASSAGRLHHKLGSE